MATFNWKDFIKGNIAVTCKTQQEYDAFMQACEDVGVKWQEDEEPATRYPDFFAEYGKKTTLACDKLTYGMQYATPAIWYAADYDVVNFEDIDEFKARSTEGAQAEPKPKQAPNWRSETAAVMARAINQIVKIADKYGVDREKAIKHNAAVFVKLATFGDFSEYEVTPDNE